MLADSELSAYVSAYPTEHEARVEAFLHVSQGLRGRRVLLYGGGVNASAVVSRLEGSDLLMATTSHDAAGVAMGSVPFASWEQALDLGADVVVIAAKTTSTEVVYERICEDCLARDMTILDLYGNDLVRLHEEAKRARGVGEEELLAALDEHDVLCIDARLTTALRDDPARLIPEARDQWRQVSEALLHAARLRGKVTILASGHMGRLVLNAYGYPVVDSVLDRERLGLTSENGFFRLLRSLYPSRRVMHVGPDRVRDVIMPRVHGVDGFQVDPYPSGCSQDEPDAATMPTETSLADGRRVVTVPGMPQATSTRDVADHSSAGEGPTATKAAHVDGCLDDLALNLVSTVDRARPRPWQMGYAALGPLVAGHVLWFARRLVDSRLDGVLFAARDAYATMRAYEAYRKVAGGTLPEARYLHTSRLAALRPLLDRPDMRMYAAALFGESTPREFLTRLIGTGEASRTHDADADEPLACLEVGEGLSLRSMEAIESRFSTLQNHEGLVSAMARRARGNAFRYLGNLGVKMGGRYAFVDLVASGTSQWLLHQYVPVELEGLYLSRRADGLLDLGIPVESYLRRFDGPLAGNLMLFEALLSSDEPSVTDFDDAGAPIFDDDPRDERDLRVTREVQAGVLAFCEGLFGQAAARGMLDVCERPISPSLAEELLEANLDPEVDVATFDSLAGRSQHDKACDPEGEVAGDAAGGACDEAVAGPGEAVLTGGRPAVTEHAPRTVRSVLLGLLAELDSVCAEHGLRYVATHGTLLGAIRHGGLVPWDDDLDVAMPRADYDRLVALAGEGALREPYFLQTPENEPGCFYGGYAKLRDSSTSAIESGEPGEGRSYNQGMWMDILPLDDCPLDDDAVERRQRWVRRWQRALYAQTYGMSRMWDVDLRRVSAYFIIADRMSREALCHRLHRACTASRHSGKLTVFAGNYRWKRNTVRYDVADIDGAVRVPFEDTTIPVPAHAREWLAQHYGQHWEDDLDVEGRTSRHEVRMDPNVSYRDLLAEEDGDHEGR